MYGSSLLGLCGVALSDRAFPSPSDSPFSFLFLFIFFILIRLLPTPLGQQVEAVLVLYYNRASLKLSRPHAW